LPRFRLNIADYRFIGRAVLEEWSVENVLAGGRSGELENSGVIWKNCFEDLSHYVDANGIGYLYSLLVNLLGKPSRIGAEKPYASGCKVADMKTGRLTRCFIGLSILLLFLAVAVAGLRGAGRWLIREDPLSPADIVVVLSGSMPYRAQKAAEVLRAGYAPEVWVSRPVNPSRELEQLGIHFVGEEEYSREVLIREGIPEHAVRILPDAIVDTEQEVCEVAREMKRTEKTRAIIVTSPQHTRRVRTLWTKLIRGDQKAIVRAAFEDPFDADHWWRNTRDAFAVVREAMGLINAWAGLPVRPDSNQARRCASTSRVIEAAAAGAHFTSVRTARSSPPGPLGDRMARFLAERRAPFFLNLDFFPFPAFLEEFPPDAEEFGSYPARPSHL
jgi:uncharacterized SAM-binding protein YcdF (DUF218 family)